jgi:hypothetical protein
MATIAIKTNSKRQVNVPVVDKNMKSYANSPFFVKKAKRAKALIDKYGLPKKTSKH